jgi:hypothetical protein
MAVGEHLTYARDFFRLDYPAEWLVRENRPVGVTEFYHPAAHTGHTGVYPPGVALMTLPETGMDLELLLRTGVFFLTRDLQGPTVERLGEQPGDGGDELTWRRLLVRGRAPVARTGTGGVPGVPIYHDIVKRVALARPGPGVLVLALFGLAGAIAPLDEDFETLRRSVRVTR